MCNHHNHEHHHGKNSFPIIRVTAAIIILVAAMAVSTSEIIKIILFTSAYLIAGGDILLKAFKNIFKGEIFDENFLMGIATLGAFAIKEYPEAIMVMVLYQIGEFLQDKAIEKSKKSITELMNIRPDYANIEKDNQITRVSPDTVKVGDIITVTAGEKIPLDGVITEGCATIDTSALTGESVPKTLTSGDNAVSGCINTNGIIKIRVTKKYSDSTVSKILELVEHSAARKTKTENFITKFAKYYTPIVVAGALLLAILPTIIFGEPFNTWLSRALIFLVISCPCALVISIPLGFFAGIGGASKCGILIKGSSYIETISKTGTIIFDKTGTLTKGTFKVIKIKPQEGISEDELLSIAAAAENYSNHPIAISLKEKYAKSVDKNILSDLTEIAGEGIKVKINGEETLIGNSKLMKKFEINFTPSEEFGTIIYVAKNNKYFGYIVISDELKEDAINTVKALKHSGLTTIMLTGDSQNAAQTIAYKLNIDKVYSQLLPSDKVEKTEEIIRSNKSKKSVIFVGDGINDAPVLTRADVGIAMGGLGSDAAIEAADIVIMDDKLEKIITAIKISKKTMAIVKENIIFALCIKALFLTLGAFGLITMWGAVFADVGVTVIAILNSLRALKI